MGGAHMGGAHMGGVVLTCWEADVICLGGGGRGRIPCVEFRPRCQHLGEHSTR